MAYFEPIRKKHRYRVQRKYARKNPIAQIKTSASKSQIMDAYGIVYRQMLKQQAKGNLESAKQLGQCLCNLGKTKKQDENKCIQLNEVLYNGVTKNRWVRIQNIHTIEKGVQSTKIILTNGNIMYVQESVNKVVTLIKQR